MRQIWINQNQASLLPFFFPATLINLITGPQDSTLRIKYTLTTRPDLSTKSSLLSLLRPFGPLEGDEESIVLSLKPPKKHPEKPPKFANAIVQFKRCEDAFGAVCASNRVERGLKDVQIDWVTGEEPKYVKWLRERPPPSKPTVSTFTVRMKYVILSLS